MTTDARPRPPVWAETLLRMSLKQSDQEAVSGDLSPTDDFYARSVVSTAIVVSLFTWTGVWTASRSRSVRASALAWPLARVRRQAS